MCRCGYLYYKVSGEVCLNYHPSCNQLEVPTDKVVG